MNVSFDSEIAKKYGKNVAVVLTELCFWIEQNKKDNVNFHDGKYWVLSSMENWSNLIDYMTINTIRHTLEKMIKEGLIITRNYNSSKRGRTKLYTLSNNVDYFIMPNKF